ncbi:ABC transporter permease [Comamonas sp. 4034]|uniref:ABC transporter permease n=1 Tax=Comamonas sp. 4034 TaxID=3156455 RepID=UPI003D244895
MTARAGSAASAAAMVASVRTHWPLIRKMTRRDVSERYTGSVVGWLWSLIIPLCMLVIYTFVFSVVFKARWGDLNESKTQFAMVLFSGLIVYGFFSDVFNRAPQLILGNVNYVKRVVFPLEILVIVAVCSALIQSLASLVVLLLALLVLNGSVPPTALLLPLIWLPLVLLTLGVGWFFASLGVFARDLKQITGVLTTMLMFISPIFFPVKALPPEFQTVMWLNPLTFFIEQSREVLIWGRAPDWAAWAVSVVVCAIMAWLGFAWFQKTRKGFADVL